MSSEERSYFWLAITIFIILFGFSIIGFVSEYFETDFDKCVNAASRLDEQDRKDVLKQCVNKLYDTEKDNQ